MTAWQASIHTNRFCQGPAEHYQTLQRLTACRGTLKMVTDAGPLNNFYETLMVHLVKVQIHYNFS